MPLSMGGANNKENLVRIPARVHFLLHWMLVRIYRTPEMAHALNMMCMNKTEMRYTSKSFTYAKALHAKEMRAKPSINKGKKLSDETKAKMSAAAKGRVFSTETKAKMSAAGKVKVFSDEHRANLSAARRVRKLVV